MKKQNTKKEVGETLVNFILDKSGSMESVREATRSGFNEYLNTLKKDGNKYRFSLTLFDTMIQTPYVDSPITEVSEMSVDDYNPDGSTALYDAICTTIKGVKERKGQKVINVIMTDGEENSSKEYTQVQMRAMIDELTKKGNWTFVYLGANQDSYANAQKYGIPTMNATNFSATPTGIKRAMNTMAANTCNFAVSTNVGTNQFFTDQDQNNLVEDKKISQHFSSLGKKSWEVRRRSILGE